MFYIYFWNNYHQNKMSQGRHCKFSLELQKEFPTFIKSKIEGEVECVTCKNAIINIRNKCRHSLLQHIGTEKHEKNIVMKEEITIM